MHMASKGMLELRGGNAPFLSPFVGAEPLDIDKWELTDYWIPSFSARAGNLAARGEILAPIGERGFGYKLAVTNTGALTVNLRFGLNCQIGGVYHTVNESKPVNAERFLYESGWNDCIVFDVRSGVSLFAFAPFLSPETKYDYASADGFVTCRFYSEVTLSPGQSAENVFWFGLGFEEVAAATSAKEMYRQTYGSELAKTREWLRKRLKFTGDKPLDDILNLNLLFCLFFSSGVTLDSEEFVLVTSRSPRYYVSAAYWDRDALLWAFPAILRADGEWAGEALRCVFTRQMRNVGVHSRYIDGTVLEPGFELDELCAPVIALKNYWDVFGAKGALSPAEPLIERGVRKILSVLRGKRSGETALYETMLQPTDDMRVYPYLTYDNALVWRALNDIAVMYNDIWDKIEVETVKKEVSAVKQAVYSHCIKDLDGKQIFAWSVDLRGGWDLYDEPPGSLLLLPFYGFCPPGDPVWQNTAEAIRRRDYAYSFADSPIAEIGCPHAPHPWVLSIANSLICGYPSAREHLLRCKMDNGIACESVDENTGECRTGEAFATCAGFLAYACLVFAAKEGNNAS